MYKYKFNSVLLGVLTVLFISVSCEAQNKKETGSVAKDVNVEEFAKLIQNSEGQLVDVRTPGEYGAGHIPNSTMIDFQSSDFDEKIEKLDKEKPVYVYCKSGGRSAGAMAKMKKAGFKEVYNLDGGYTAWDAAGQKVEK